MIQAIGLTKSYRRARPPALTDLSFTAPPGRITALLGPPGAGKSTALRLVLGLERGQGVALFDGRPYHRIRRPERELGVLLPGAGSSPGHPGRRARSHLRMLAAAAGVPAHRADQLLEQTRLAPAADHRLRSFSPGMSRRLLLAAALLGNPHTLLLDAPTEELSPKNVEWFHAFLRAFASSGGTVLLTCASPQEAAGLADRVLTLDQGSLLADQPVDEFVRGWLRPEVVVRGPQIGRLADLLAEVGAEVRRESGARISVSGADRTEIGELAYRHGILLHELADQVVERGPAMPGRAAAAPVRPHPMDVEPVAVPAVTAPSGAPRAAASNVPVGATAHSGSTVPYAPYDPAEPEETVVVLAPGASVTATVRPVPSAGPTPPGAPPGASPVPGWQTRAIRDRSAITGPLFRDPQSPSHDQLSHDQLSHDQLSHDQPHLDPRSE